MNLDGIRFNDANGQIMLQAQPAERPEITPQILQVLLAEAGWGACQTDDAVLSTAATMCNAQQSPFELVLAQRLDGTVRVQIGPDDMSALLDIGPARGGRPASLEQVHEALTQAGVVAGIDTAVLLRACQAGQCSGLTVARGQVAQDGADASFEPLVPDAIERAPKLNEVGLIDYREHGDVPVVKVGQPLMRRHPAGSGTPGQTVKGMPLPAMPGHDAPFAAKLDGAQVSPQDPNLLLASVSGQPVRVSAGVVVEPVLRVKEVNMGSGNIHFDGTVQVSGDVLQGMKVQASGDIVVDGMVDGGVLDAGGNIVVAGGVIAHARLHAAGSVTARFAEGAQITAGTVIAIGDMVIDCDLHSLNQILIGASAPERARLVGGSAAAALLLRVPLLGSAKAGVTRVTVGTNPELEERYARLLERIEAERANEANLEKLIKQLKAIGDPKHMLDRVKASRQHAVQVWGASLAEKQELEHELAVALSAQVQVSVGVAGAVDLSFGHRLVPLRREFDSGCFSMDAQGQVLYTADNAQVQVLAKA